MSTDKSTEKYEGFSADEIAAMKDYAAELKRSKGGNKKEAEYRACLDALAALDGTDKAVGQRLHTIVSEVAPDLVAKTWYGMPAYHRDNKVIVFFKPASKFDVRYAEVGFNEFAQLDDGDMWPTAFAVTAMNDTIEKKLRQLVKKAAS